MPLRHLPQFSLSALLALGLAACADPTTVPGSLRFGQIGEVRLQLSTPLLLGEGELQQSLTWNSSGPWQLTEAISYHGVTGDTVTVKSTTTPDALAGSYAVWITQVNDIAGLRLFVPELDPALNPPCTSQTKVTLRIKDAVKAEEARWVRCVPEGSLANLGTVNAGPDAAAARVVNAALLLREYTLPTTFTSVFNVSYPFATIASGENTAVPLDAPLVIDNQASYTQFWITHTGSASATPPTVDFTRQFVLVAAIGKRPEAGESVEVRRVIPSSDGTIVQVVWRVPGNFCSPVAREHRPYHVIVAPRVPLPITFAQVTRVEVPCG